MSQLITSELVENKVACYTNLWLYQFELVQDNDAWNITLELPFADEPVNTRNLWHPSHSNVGENSWLYASFVPLGL